MTDLTRALSAFFVYTLAVLSLSGSPALGQEISSEKVEAQEVIQLHFKSMAGFQTEIWINGKRAGFTPCSVRVTPGKYWFSSSAESIEPIFQWLTVAAGSDDQVIRIPPSPITKDNYSEVYRKVQRMMLEGPKDPHNLLIGLHITIDAEDGRDLVNEAMKGLKGDPMLSFHHARVLLLEDNPQEALEVVEQGIRTNDKIAFGWRTRAMVLKELGRFDEALECCNEAMLVDPYCWRNLRIRAEVHGALGNKNAQKADSERAEEMYRRLYDPTGGK